MTITASLEAHLTGAMAMPLTLVLIAAAIIALAYAAQWGAEYLVKQVRIDLAAEASGEPLLELPHALLKRLFVGWLTLNAAWLAHSAWLTPVQWICIVLLLAVLGMLALIDAETGILPNELIIVCLCLAFGYSRVTTGHWLPGLDSLWGMTLGYALPMGLNAIYRWVTTREALGQGDAKLLAALGLWFGTRALADLWIVACVLLLVYTAGRKLGGQTALHLKMSLPFGPFLVLAANAIVIIESF